MCMDITDNAVQIWTDAGCTAFFDVVAGSTFLEDRVAFFGAGRGKIESNGLFGDDGCRASCGFLDDAFDDISRLFRLGRPEQGAGANVDCEQGQHGGKSPTGIFVEFEAVQRKGS